MQLDTIKAMERLARQDESVISLGQGIPASNLDIVLRQAAIKVIQAGSADAYSDPQGLLELRRAIARQTASENVHYSVEETIITAGAIEAINVALRSVITPERPVVIIPTPSYSAYFALVEQAHGTVRQLPLDESRGWALSLGRLKKQIDKNVAAILLCNPNNPTGTIHDRQTMQGVAEIASSAGVPLIIDEVYRHITYQPGFYSPAEATTYRNTVIRVMSFSKDFAMTGWRVGYIQAAASRIPRLTAIHDSLVNCAPVISQYVALAALEESKRIFASNQQLYQQRRLEMQKWLDATTGIEDYTIPAGGYFFFPRLVPGQTSNHVAKELVARGVATVPGDAFGAGGEGHIRLCFGRSSEAIQQGMQRVVQYYQTK
jgi:aminotransferase